MKLPLIALAESRTNAVEGARSAAVSAQRTGAPRTRDEVSAEVVQAMRDGKWRCLANNRGWCDRPMRAGPHVLAGAAAGEVTNPAPPWRPPLQSS